MLVTNPPSQHPCSFLSLTLSASVSLSCSIRVHRSCHGNVNDCERPLGAHIEMHDTRGSTREGQAVGGKAELLNSADKLGYVEASVE